MRYKGKKDDGDDDDEASQELRITRATTRSCVFPRRDSQTPYLFEVINALTRAEKDRVTVAGHMCRFLVLVRSSEGLSGLCQHTSMASSLPSVACRGLESTTLSQLCIYSPRCPRLCLRSLPSLSPPIKSPPLPGALDKTAGGPSCLRWH